MDDSRVSPTSDGLKDDRRSCSLEIVAMLRLASAELQLDLVSPDVVVQRAAELLGRVPSDYAELAALAGAEPYREEVGELLDSALDHEGGSVPTRPEAGRLVAARVCRGIVADEIAPVEGARLIWWKVVRQIPALEDELLRFVGLASDWEDDPDHRPEIESDIRMVAAEFA